MQNTFNYFGLPDTIMQVQENCPADVFENAIRKFGVTSACEWFGYSADSEFTSETIEYLRRKSLD